MRFLKVITCIALLSQSNTVIEAACGVCSMASKAACINETAFLVCYDGMRPSSQIEICKENTVCTEAKGVCQPNTADVIPSCVSLCNYCAGPFACVSQTQFGFCNENGTLGHVAACPNGYICSVDELLKEGTICVLSNAAAPTCQRSAIEPPAKACKDIELQQTFQITTRLSKGHACTTDELKGCIDTGP